MRKRLGRWIPSVRVLTVLGAGCCCALAQSADQQARQAQAARQQAAPAQTALVGRWDMVSESEGDPVRWTFVVKEVEGKLTGSLATDDGEQQAKDFSYSDGVVRFKAPYQGQDYDIELRLNAGKLEGTWSGGGNSGRTSGVKSS